MILGFIKGFSEYFSAFGFITKHKLWSYFLLSGLLSVAIGVVIFGGVYFLSDDVGAFLLSWYPFDFGFEYLERIITYVSGGLMGIIGFLLFKYILLIIISPFMGPLSAKVESIETGNYEGGKFSLKQVTYEMIRGVRIALRNITKEIGYTLILIILGFIPLLTIFVTPLIFLVQSYYAGFSNFDYFLERRTNVKGSIAYNRAHRGQVIGNGAAFMLLLLIPILGFFLAPILGTVSATRTALKNNDLPDII